MDIKELCRLCSKYSANKLMLKLKYAELEDRLEYGWEKTSIGIRQIKIVINNCETENAEIESKIKEVATVSFN